MQVDIRRRLTDKMRLNSSGKHPLSLPLGIDVGAIDHRSQSGLGTLMTDYIELPFRPLPIARQARQLKQKSAVGAIVRIGLNFAHEFFDCLVKLACREQPSRLLPHTPPLLLPPLLPPALRTLYILNHTA